MKILRVEVQGFRSFTAVQSLDFVRLPAGFYHVAGHNKVEPALEANGAGKSSLFEAVHWGLYGKTSRGLRGNTVKNWNGEETCAVILDVETAAGRFSILRTWPNVLEIQRGDEPAMAIDQEQLDELLGMSLETFSFAVHFPQFSQTFVDLDARRQSDIFSAVLALELWEKAISESRKVSSEEEDQQHEYRESIARVEGQAEQLLSEDYEEQETAWSKQHKTRLAATLDLIKTHTESAARHTAQAKKAASTSTAFRKAREVLQEHEVDIREAKRKKKTAEEDLAAIEKKDYKNCPTCGAPISNAHVKREVQKKKNEQVAAAIVLSELWLKHDHLTKVMAQHRDGEVALLEATREMDAAIAKKEAAEETYQTLLTEKNPYTEQRKRAQQLAKNLEAELARFEKQLGESTRREQAADFWVKAFKQIRLDQIDHSLSQLTLEVNEVLFQLGLRDWSIAFAVERETKSGTVARNFTTMVSAPPVKKAVPWEVWCGGESQRLRLAITMGFANLVCSRCGVQPNIEFWDEPSTWLSEAGIYNLLEVLQERAERQKKIILIADHRALDFGGFTDVLTVTKSKDGSILQGRACNTA